ncbi:hypothetical protein Glo7428_1349 [Gloeocapsa sp. PCC 7428]|uniref:DUF4007 family protein n=1 Tax=Gloeocapsa sp. PCC 7428 TaxID=1173026 RepID=UPI0002A61AAA|nr:DUF4007 family protein [Gloeocapsa sp. PCC 7428]AFZ29917.1 hypothetical protein Glo7428_1349 [Gloeocapsa sp. PCC 7428]
MIRQISLDLEENYNQTLLLKPLFAHHETFHPRFGWLKKGFDWVNQDPEIFLREDAPVRLGVGKNMVRSIRYWCSAFKLLEDEPETNRNRFTNSSDFGKKLLNNDGWDEFIEDPASLWLLHWNLLKPTCRAAAWYFIFNEFHQIEFSVDELFKALSNYRDLVAPRIADSSLKKDITCILRMYVEQNSKTAVSEDSLDCPFAELGLIQTAGDAKHYAFQIGSKTNLPAEIIVSACLEFASTKGKQKTISISSLTFDPSSPGRAFKLTESALYDAIEQVGRWSNDIYVVDSAGLIQFSFTKDAKHLADDILDKYYSTRRSGANL